jgi:hypothetical protein
MAGGRLPRGCSRDHAAHLMEQYERHPFLETELWAVKIARASVGGHGALPS